MAGVGVVLLYEPDDRAAEQISSILDTTGLVLQRLASPAELAAASSAYPKAVVMAAVDGPAAPLLLDQIAASPARGRTLLLAGRADFALRLAAARSGAAHLLAKPVDAGRLPPILERLGRQEADTPYRVLIVGDDRLSNLYHAALLAAEGLAVSTAESGEQALAMARRHDPDLILPDYYLGDCSGAELVAMLRDDERLAQLRVIFLSGRDVRDLETDVFDALGEDFVCKPVDPQSFVSLVRSRAAHARRARRLNDELRLAQRATRNVRQALDAHAIVAVTDQAGDLVYVNDKFCRTSGYRREELLGQSHRLVRSGLHGESFYADIRNALAAGRAWQGELCNRTRRGDLYWVQSTIMPSLGDDGLPYQYVSVSTDITPLKEAENSLRQAKEVAEQASRAKTDFLSRMTHELRTPLNAILGFAQLLETDPVDRPSAGQAESLGQIQRAGWHLLELINEVLDLARIEAGRLEVTRVDFPMRDVVDDCLTLISMLAGRHGVTVVNRLAEGTPPWVHADPLRLKQIVLNVLSNAVKYNRHGGSVSIAAVPVDGGWRLDVADTGIGMSEEQLARLFQPFTRFVSDGQQEGTGIGLAITRRLVDAMGGYIEVRSREGEGSTFSITLPGVADEAVSV